MLITSFRVRLLPYILIHLAYFFSIAVFSHEQLTTNDMNDVLTKIQSFEKQRQINNLVVFDIDNTLLSTDNLIGSDQWFEWQAQLVSTGNRQYAVANSIPELISTYCKMLPLVQTRPTQNDLAQVLNALKRTNASIILLTSRGPTLRSTTEENLKLHNLWLAEKSFHKGIIDPLLVPGFNLQTSFMSGIFMTSGIHKGEALKFILKFSNRSFSNIIFVDDHEKHVNRVQETFKNQSAINVVTFRYGREDHAVEAFKKMNKEPIHQKYLNIVKVLNDVFPKRSFNSGFRPF